MPNGKVVLKGAEDTGEFWIADSDDLDNYGTTGKKIEAGANFDLYGLFTPSDFEKSNTSKGFILSFVTSGSPNEYKNYYYDGTNVNAVNNALGPIANFAVVGLDLYVLTTEGKLHCLKSGDFGNSTELKNNAVGMNAMGSSTPSMTERTSLHHQPSSVCPYSASSGDPKADSTTVARSSSDMPQR